MNDSEIIKIIVENTKAITNMQGTISNLYHIMDNLIASLHENNVSTELTSQKIELLRETIDETLAKIEEIRKKLEVLTLQNDWKEMNGIKTKKINEKLEGKLEKKKFTWAEFGEGVKLFFKNSKWILAILVIVILMILVGFNIIQIEEAWEYIKKMLEPNITTPN